MVWEVNCMCKFDFLFNVVLNKSKEIIVVFVGEIFDIYKEGCVYVKDYVMFKCD